MTIEDSLAYLNTFLNYEKTPLNANLPRDFNLLRLFRLLDALGRPHERIPAVHVAGTKGKGSTCAFTESILRTAGYRTGLYTSPHLIHPTERIRVDGTPIAPEAFAALVDRLRPLLDAYRESEHGSLTFFEVYTALAFQHFVDAGVEISVVEVGMGGRLDATNVLTPVVAAITPVGLDHLAALGNTLDSIAREKAGIIKPRRPLALAPQTPSAREVILDFARAQGAPVYEVGSAIHADRIGIREGREWCSLQGDACRLDGVGLRLLGQHQVDNAATAFGIALRLRAEGWRISDTALLNGLCSATLAGRFQVVPAANGKVIVGDCAHTTEAATALRRTLADVFGNRPVAFVVGMSADKDARGFAFVLAPVAASAYLTRTRDNLRAADPEALARIWQNHCPKARATDSVADAIAAATDDPTDDLVVCVTGSVFLVGDAFRSLGINPFVSTQ